MESVVIRPTRGFIRPGFSELWRYRELLFFLVWRDVKVRYKQTFFGASWAIIQPFILMVVFTMIGSLAKLPSDKVPRPLFIYAGLVPWTLFSQSLVGSSTSLVAGANLVRKIYFPRLILPLSACGSFILDFFIAMVALIGMMIYYGVTPTASIVWLPALTLLALTTAMSVGIWLSAINARYRDVQYAVPFLIQVWLWASPVAYGASLLPDRWKALYAINPMAGVVEGFRWALLGTKTKPGSMIVVSSAMTVVLLVAGVLYFKREERTFADVI